MEVVLLDCVASEEINRTPARTANKKQEHFRRVAQLHAKQSANVVRIGTQSVITTTALGLSPTYASEACHHVAILCTNWRCARR